MITNEQMKKIQYVIFGDKNSVDDYGLILSKYEVDFPKRKTITFSSFLVSGEKDVTEDILGSTPIYDNRKIRLTLKSISSLPMSKAKRLAFENEVHGKYFDRINIVDPIRGEGWLYEGRCTINKFASDSYQGIYTVEINAKPTRKQYFESTFTISLKSREQITFDGSDYGWISDDSGKFNIKADREENVYVGRRGTSGTTSAKLTTTYKDLLLNYGNGAFIIINNGTAPIDNLVISVKVEGA